MSYLDYIYDCEVEQNLGCETCRECRYFIKTPDAYGTGDSPTAIECNGLPKDCPLVRAEVASMWDIVK